MITETQFDQQIVHLQEQFQICLTPLQIAAISQHFLNDPAPEILTLEFTDEQWQQRVAVHPIETWVAEGTRDFEVELVNNTLTSRIKGALGTSDELPRNVASTLEDYAHRRHQMLSNNNG